MSDNADLDKAVNHAEKKETTTDVNSITSTTDAKNSTNIEQNKIICAICMEDIKKDDNSIWTPCIHGFHDVCINLWLDQNKYKMYVPCPTCKTDINDIFPDRIVYDEDDASHNNSNSETDDEDSHPDSLGNMRSMRSIGNYIHVQPLFNNNILDTIPPLYSSIIRNISQTPRITSELSVRTPMVSFNELLNSISRLRQNNEEQKNIIDLDLTNTANNNLTSALNNTFTRLNMNGTSNMSSTPSTPNTPNMPSIPNTANLSTEQKHTEQKIHR